MSRLYDIAKLIHSLKKFKNKPFVDGVEHIVIPKISQAKKNFINQPEGSNGHYIRSKLLLTIYKTIATNKDFFKDLPRIVFCWAEKENFPYQGNKIYAEHGWLPRFHYQISSSGCNSRSHIKFDNNIDYIELFGGRRKFEKVITNLKQMYNDPKADKISEPFYLVALQTGNDFNLLHSNTEFSCFYGLKHSNELVGQAVIEKIESQFKDIKLVFTQHPSDKYGNFRVGNLKNTIFHNSDNIKSIDLLRQDNCKGVISINSNLLHESLLYSKPIVALGTLMWANNNNPFNNTFGEINTNPTTCEQYLAMLLCYQWNISDFENPYILRELFLNTNSLIPVEIRNTYSLF